MDKTRIKFWGVRGSFPTPHRDKIDVGGNTSCVEVRTANNELIIFDMGTGLIPLGNSLLNEKSPPTSAHIFLSHFHWDHIIGYLGFTPFFSNKFSFNIYGKQDNMNINDIFSHLHNFTFWPVDIPMYQAKFNLQTFPKDGLKISDSIIIKTVLHGHPNGANTYRLEIDSKVIVYCTDIEHPDKRLNKNIIDICSDADVLIKDAQFTDEQLINHKGWGHSSWQQCTQVAKEANVKKLVLFHHNPNNNDDAIAEIEKRARSIFPNTIAAREGLEIILD